MLLFCVTLLCPAHLLSGIPQRAGIRCSKTMGSANSARESDTSDRGDIRNLEVTQVMCEAECWTEHHLVNSVLTMHTIPTHHKKKIIRPPFNVSKLTNISRKKQFAQDLGDRLTSHGHMTRK
ncbi:hypothetical protein ElyMa_003208500 [Elysia marginata]|uniref:Uncharacterized protein n=1 Tax=Elysia marginata TaxID=1093978 RepID=A0AAV4J1Q8_9GAST|nr:hypothetical protein ElyMa_003208500 [Elysia marginata]